MRDRDDETGGPNRMSSGAAGLQPQWTDDGHLDEGTIHTWLDDAFDAAEADMVRVHVASCAACQEGVAEARGLIAGSARIASMLDGVPAGVVGKGDVERTVARIVADATRVVPATRGARSWYNSVPFRVAATLVLFVGSAAIWMRAPEPSVVSEVESAREAPDSAPRSVSQAVPQSAKAALQPTNPVTSPKNASPMAPVRIVEKLEPPVERRSSPFTTSLIVPSAAENAAKASSAVAGARDEQTPASRVVTGRVVTQQGAAIPHAVITTGEATGATPVGAQTDSVGRFSIRVADSQPRISARQLGYEPARMVLPMSGRDSIDTTFVLKPSVLALSQVVVTSTAESAAPAQQCYVLVESSSPSVPSSMSSTAPTSRSVPGRPVAPLRMRFTEAPSAMADGASQLAVWYGWLSNSNAVQVTMTRDADGTLRGSATADTRLLEVVLRERTDGWEGTAVSTAGTIRTSQTIRYRHADAARCK